MELWQLLGDLHSEACAVSTGVVCLAGLFGLMPSGWCGPLGAGFTGRRWFFRPPGTLSPVARVPYAAILRRDLGPARGRCAAGPHRMA